MSSDRNNKNTSIISIKRKLVIILATLIVLQVIIIAQLSIFQSLGKPELTGKMVYHTYSDYLSRDSKLYLVDFKKNNKVCLNDNFTDVEHTMNGSFSPDGKDIVFMGVTKREYADEWDIFKYDLDSKLLINLTKNNGYRNEDPKFSPDGRFIVYKKGYWSNKLEQTIYDICELELDTGISRNITNNLREESMPNYSVDGKYIYYMRGLGADSEICKVDRRGESYGVECIFKDIGVQSYYPAIYKNKVYFSKWHSRSNSTDMLVILDENGNKTYGAFNNPDYNISDSYPICDEIVMFSGTMEELGEGGYDLYVGNISTGQVWKMNDYIKVNDKNHQLGVSYFK